MIKIEMKIAEKYKRPIGEFVRRALEKYGGEIEEIILFGSVARGEAREDSDVDILVVGNVSLEELVDISFPILLEYEELISAEGIKLYEGMGKAFGEGRREIRGSKSFV
jgi:predicted nucleotidyltransferase